MRLIVHPGLPKTVTSWGQQYALPLVVVPSVWKSNGDAGAHRYLDPDMAMETKGVFPPVNSGQDMSLRYRIPHQKIVPSGDLAVSKVIEVANESLLRSGQ